MPTESEATARAEWKDYSRAIRESGVKTCPGCNKSLPLASFGPLTSSKHGRQSRCLPCKRTYQKKHPGNYLENGRRYREQHPETALYAQLRRRRGTDVPTKPEFTAWYISIPHICAYCGLTEVESKSLFGHRLNVDRLDNAKGYNLDNVCLACPRCNVVKNAHLTPKQMEAVAGMFFKRRPTHKAVEIQSFDKMRGFIEKFVDSAGMPSWLVAEARALLASMEESE